MSCLFVGRIILFRWPPQCGISILVLVWWVITIATTFYFKLLPVMLCTHLKVAKWCTSSNTADWLTLAGGGRLLELARQQKLKRGRYRYNFWARAVFVNEDIWIVVVLTFFCCQLSKHLWMTYLINYYNPRSSDIWINSNCKLHWPPTNYIMGLQPPVFLHNCLILCSDPPHEPSTTKSVI